LAASSERAAAALYPAAPSQRWNPVSTFTTCRTRRDRQTAPATRPKRIASRAIVLLTCNDQSQSPSQHFSQLVATAQHPQSLPSPPETPVPPVQANLRAPPKSRQHCFGCNTSILRRHCPVPAFCVLIVGFVSTKPRHPHPASRAKRAQRPFHRTCPSSVVVAALHNYMDS
jgi:hypothetical protein